MKKHTIIAIISITISLCTVFALFLYAFINRSQLSNPPTLEEAENYFRENRKDLDIVVDFLANQENDVVIVCYSTRLENWKDITIPPKVRRAIKRLRNGQNRIIVTKDENKIDITIWVPSVQEMSSGFVYSIDAEITPDIQYATVMEPMSEPRWYFYIEDFNTWRVESSRSSEK